MSNRSGQSLGNYRLVRLLGQGGFSDVYLGEHIHLNTYAAIKVLHAQLAEDSIDHFRTEARTLARLKHPNIVQVLDFGVEGLTPYLTMQYAPNGTLRQRHPRRVPVGLNVVISYVQQVGSALQYAHHQKLIHRDIKPENMLVGEQNQILLSDFGVAIMTASARAASPASASGSWNSAGTASYMAPEQIQGHTVPASDQYALATVVYEWLTGVVPFNGSYMEVVSQQIAASPAPLREKVPTIPPDIEHIVLTALHKDPQQRFGSIEAFGNALQQAAQSVPVAVVVTTPPKNTDGLINRAPTSSSTPTSSSSEVSKMEAALIGPLGRTVIGTMKLTIGSAPNNTIVLSDAQASPYHAELRPEGGQYILVDLRSMNGTFVNEQQITDTMPRPLQTGDAVRIGDTRFTFEISNDAQRAFYGSDASTIRATPPPPPATPNYANNTAYGIGNAYPAMPYNQEMFAASPTPMQTPYPNQPPNNMPPQMPFASETQMPTYINSAYGQPGQQPQYTPAQQPQYTPMQQPQYTPMQQGSLPQYTPMQQPPYMPSAQLPPQPPPTQVKKSPLRMIIIGVVAFIVVVASIVGLAGYHNYTVGQDNIHATATALTASQHTTATAISERATATSIASATAVASATAAATSQYPPFMHIAINDTLTSGTDWGGASTACQTSSTGMQIGIQEANTFQYCLHAGEYSDLAFQTTMSITQGDCGGFDFRDISGTGFFFFRVCQDGTYNIGANSSTQTILLHKDGDPTSSAIIQGLNKQNTIGVTVQGDTINAYVNGKNIDNATDPDLTTNPQGRIGLLAEDLGNPTTVIYTHALVWTMA